jgi:DNA-binding transcriptional ArsR family regulator
MLLLRLHLTPEDLGRVQLADPDVMAELVHSAHVLAQGQLGPHYAGLGRDVPRAARPLLELVEPPDGFPDFLMPNTGDPGFAARRAAVLDTSSVRLRQELGQYYGPGWTQDPAEVRRRLAAAIDAYYESAFRQRWPDLAAIAVDAHAVRARVLASDGLDGLLSNIYPTISWRRPVLTIACESERGPDVDVRLCGRGLRLKPVTALHHPMVADRPGEPFEITYPARMTRPSPTGSRALTALLGRTRAQILRVIDAGATTTQLASRVGVSKPSASEHATVLRESGLIVSDRVGNAVVHRLTPLGTALLRSPDPH